MKILIEIPGSRAAEAIRLLTQNVHFGGPVGAEGKYCNVTVNGYSIACNYREVSRITIGDDDTVAAFQLGPHGKRVKG